MAAMNMGVRRGVLGVSFHLRTCPQGVASVLCKKTPIFGSRRSKLDHLTVHTFVSNGRISDNIADSLMTTREGERKNKYLQ